MKVIKVKDWNEIPKNYTGIANWHDGSKQWWLLNGHFHREDGPAREWNGGEKQWWQNGKFLFELPPESKPFVLLEEFIDEEGKEQIKVLTQKGIETWPNLPGLKELADNWEKK